MSFMPGYTANYDTGAAGDNFAHSIEAPNTGSYHAFQHQTLQQTSPVQFGVPSGDQSHDIVGVTQAHSAGPHICQQCGKQFLRKCDLNKHFKTHSRRFKCLVSACSYSEQGFPTQKELERHLNDKHTPNPKVYACLYSSCDYKSPRESNCKAHMEKAHGHPYLRTRSRRLYQCPFPGCNDCPSEEVSRQRHAQLHLAIPSHMYPNHSRDDFVLYPESQGPGMLPYSQIGALGHSGMYQPSPTDSFLPWTSPATRLQNVETDIQRVNETVVAEPRNFAMSPVPLNIPLDPQLFQTPSTQTLLTPVYSPAMMRQSARAFPTPEYGAPTSVPAGYVETKEQINVSITPIYSSRAGDEPKSGGPQQTPTRSREPMSASLSEPPAVKFEESDNEDSGEEDDGPPRKKARASHDGELEDDKVPCPFREHDPLHFSRDNDEKFSPCHSKHPSIASLVRHLRRPAHKLKSDRRSISSFHVQSEDHDYPRVGLCKSCWRAFTDQQVFEEHLRQSCVKTSRGKREKYNLLRDTFVTGSQSSLQSLAAPRAQSSPATTSVSNLDVVDDEIHSSMVMPTAPVAPTTAPAPGMGHETIMSVMRSLEEKIDNLEKQQTQTTQDFNRRIEALELWSRSRPHDSSEALFRTRQGGSGSIMTELATSLLAANTSSTPRGPRSRISSVISRDPATDYAPEYSVQQEDNPRTLSQELVGGMDSLQTGVDRQVVGFNTDVTRTMSGLSSSSGRSSVRHVPPPSFDNANEGPASGAVSREKKRRRVVTPSPQKVAPSLTDSGYASRWRPAETNDEHDDEHHDEYGRMSDVEEEASGAPPDESQEEMAYRLSQSDFLAEPSLNADQVADMFS